MKKLLIVALCIGLVGCTTKEAQPQESATPTPTSEETQTPMLESKINIDLYKADEYYPIVDGVVTYPDGTTEEFNHGRYIRRVDGTDEEVYLLYEEKNEDDDLSDEKTKEEMREEGYPFYIEVVNGVYSVGVTVDLLSGYEFVQSSYNEGDTVDGVFGIEYTAENGGKLPFVIYRYSNALPKGEELNESFRSYIGEDAYYVWRIKEYDDLEGFEGYEYYDRQHVIWWGFIEGEGMNPHLLTFE